MESSNKHFYTIDRWKQEYLKGGFLLNTPPGDPGMTPVTIFISKYTSTRSPLPVE